MAQWTLWGAHQLAASWFSRSAIPPQEYYLALIADTEPDSFITGAELDEPFEGGYQRLLVPNETEVWGSNMDAIMTNLTELRFAPATTDWGTITFWALCSAPTEGYVYMYGEFVDPLYVSLDDEVVISPGLVQLEFSDVYQELAHE